MPYKTGSWGNQAKKRSKQRLEYFLDHTRRSPAAKKSRDYYFNLKRRVFSKFGNKCNHCGITDPRVFQVDHVNNDGYKDSLYYNKRKGKKNDFKSYLRKVLKDTEGRYQLLCANCNWIKKAENQKYKRR